MQTENRIRPVLIAAFALAVIILALYWIFPIEKDEMHTGALGGVEKAERFRETTISQENVTLQDMEKFEFFQSAAFQNLAKDPDALKRIFSTEFQQLYNESQMTAVRFAADFLKQTQAYKLALTQLENSGLKLSDFELMSDEERQGMAFYSTIYKLADDELKQTLANIDFPIIVLMEQNPSLSMVEWNPPNYTIFSREEDWVKYYCNTIDNYIGSKVYKKLDMNMVSLSPILSVVYTFYHDIDFQKLSPLASYSANLATDLALQNAIHALKAVNFQNEANVLSQLTATNMMDCIFKAADNLPSNKAFDAQAFNNRFSQVLFSRLNLSEVHQNSFNNLIDNSKFAQILGQNLHQFIPVWSRPEVQQLSALSEWINFMQMNFSSELKQQIFSAMWI